MTDAALDAIYADVQALCAAFRSALRELGIDAAGMSTAVAERCRFSTSVDPYEGEAQVLGEWLASDGSRYAHFVRYGNGRMFAEHDVLRAHPHKPGQFVEAIEVWGEAGSLKRDVRTLPAL